MRSQAIGEPYELEYRFRRAGDGTYRWFLGRAVPYRDASGAVIKWFGTATDIDDQVRSKNMLGKAFTEVEHIVAARTDELAAMNKILAQQSEELRTAVEALQRDSARLNKIITTQYLLAKADLDLDAFIQLVVERMALLTPASGVVVEMVDGDEMVYRAAVGSVASYIGLRLKANNSLSGLCVLNREVLICIDTEQDSRVNVTACRQVNARSMVVAPLFNAGESVGVLKIMSSQPNVFGDSDVQTLQLMAGLIGAAIGHQNDYETNRRLLFEREEAIENLKQEMAQRSRMQQDIRASELRTRTIIESSHDAFISMDAQGIILDWNQQAETIFGWTRQEALEESLANLIMPERFRQAHTEGMKRFITTGTRQVLDKRIELTGLHKNGKEFPIELTIRALSSGGSYEFCAFLRDITERKLAEERLLYLAHNDQLTGVPNRGLFNDRIVEAMRRSKRAQSLMGLMYLDIDYFKSVNDIYGHKVGDALLIEFSRRLCITVRATDTVARLGGDEFIIILEALQDRLDAEKIAEKIVANIRKDIHIEDIRLNVTTSIGLTFYCGENIEADQLVHNADDALYRAKQAGRDCVRA